MCLGERKRYREHCPTTFAMALTTPSKLTRINQKPMPPTDPTLAQRLAPYRDPGYYLTFTDIDKVGINPNARYRQHHPPLAVRAGRLPEFPRIRGGRRWRDPGASTHKPNPTIDLVLVRNGTAEKEILLIERAGKLGKSRRRQLLIPVSHRSKIVLHRQVSGAPRQPSAWIVTFRSCLNRIGSGICQRYILKRVFAA